jgi:hypothetical protein
MRSLFEATVSALAYTIVRERCGATSGGAEPTQNQVVRRVLDQHAHMPDFIRLGIACLTIALDLWAVPLTGKLFHRLDHAERWRLINAWHGKAPALRRDLLRFFESLTVFGWFAERHEGSRPAG